MNPAAAPARVFAAIDLGASSGRVIAGTLASGEVSMTEVHRFESFRVTDGNYLRWDIERVFAESLVGLRAVQRLCDETGARFSGIGVDSWGVDYGLLSQGRVDLTDVRHHRGAGVPADGYAAFVTTEQERYAATGILDQPINTVQQLAARVAEGTIAGETTVLFIPDLWIYLLSGSVGTEPTIASTSQLLDLRTGNWSKPLLNELSSAGVAMPPLKMSGSYAGATTSQVTRELGASASIPVFRIAGHDTACALGFAEPASSSHRTVGIVSSGTWSLAGLSLEQPVATEPARIAGFTTERGLRGYLMVRNLSGMWLLQESLAAWSLEDECEVALPPLLDAAETATTDSRVLDLADPRLLQPGNMPDRLRALALEVKRTPPESRADTVRLILDSLASAYAASIHDAALLAGVEVDEIRIVGGGSRNALLCQLTADRARRRVVAGPVEATAVGNLVLQIWAAGIVETIEDAYATVSADTWKTTRYLPKESLVQS